AKSRFARRRDGWVARRKRLDQRLVELLIFRHRPALGFLSVAIGDARPPRFGGTAETGLLVDLSHDEPPGVRTCQRTPPCRRRFRRSVERLLLSGMATRPPQGGT